MASYLIIRETGRGRGIEGWSGRDQIEGWIKARETGKGIMQLVLAVLAALIIGVYGEVGRAFGQSPGVAAP